MAKKRIIKTGKEAAETFVLFKCTKCGWCTEWSIQDFIDAGNPICKNDGEEMEAQLKVCK